MEEEDMVVLPPSFEQFIESLNITFTDIDLKFEELSTKLLQQNKGKKQFGSGNGNEGLEFSEAEHWTIPKTS